MILESKEATKKYGSKTAVDHVSLKLESGLVYAMLGPNGSGKTTWMKMTAGLVKPTSGEILYQNQPIGKESKKEIAYMSTEPYFYNWMTVADVGNYYADFFEDFSMEKYQQMITRMELTEDMKAKKLSSGMMAKLKIAVTMARKAKIYLLDEPEMIGERIQEVTDIYYEYYDRFYDVIKDEEGGNAYTVFQIWGPGRTVKLQCDFSAMMSPEDFRKYIQPSLRSQSENVDHVLYHLDGPAAIKHMDALMEIEGIDALQWTSGDAGPDGTLPDWDVIYDKAIAAGKSIWVKVYSGEFEDWIRNVDRIVNKYGSHSLFLLFPEMSMEQAAYILDYADRNWSDVKGTFVESLGR